MSHEETIFAEALAQPPAQRAIYLNQACGSDTALRERIVTLLAAHACLDTFLDLPGFERALEKFGERPGDTIGRYTLVEELGEGGCGVVYLAEQAEPVRRRVALKVIKAGMDTREVIGRFAAERQALALMEHPGIAKIYDAGTTPAGRPFFVMELVRGVPITTFCDQQALTIEARLELFIRICDAVQHAHHKGIIHRDLKPSNILVMQDSAEPLPKVIDFGIAKATQGNLTDEPLVTKVEQFIGTPAYMSPEQAGTSALDIDTRSDVYSLGVLLYELLVGQTPFDSRTLHDVGLDEARRMIREVEPPRPSRRFADFDEAERATVTERRNTEPARLGAVLRGDLDWIAMKALEKNRAWRYETPAALAADIARHLRHEPVAARPPSKLYRVKKTLRRNRLAFAAAAALSLSLLAGTIVSRWQAVRAGKEEARANRERERAVGAHARAEQLLEFMLGELRTEVKKVGKLDLLESVGDQATAYFASLDPQDLDDQALFTQAKTLRQIGEVQKDKARYAEAMQSFETAYARTQELLSKHPGDGPTIYERAQAEFYIGFVHWEKGDFAQAREWLIRYRDSAAELVQIDASNLEWRREVFSGLHNLAVLELETGKVDAARNAFTAELAMVRELAVSRTRDFLLQAKIADIHSWLGRAAEQAGNFSEALDRYALQIEVLEALTRKDPQDKHWRAKLANGLAVRASLLAIMGQRAASLQERIQARAILDELVKQDPDNRRWLIDSLTFVVREAMVLKAEGNLRVAAQRVREAIPELETLAEAEPTDRTLPIFLMSAYRLEAELRQAMGVGGAKSAILRAKAIGEPFVRTARGNAQLVGEYAVACLAAGRIANEEGDSVGARQHWMDASETVLSAVHSSNHWRLLDPAARALAVLGREAESRAIIDRLHSFGYRPLEPWIVPQGTVESNAGAIPQERTK